MTAWLDALMPPLDPALGACLILALLAAVGPLKLYERARARADAGPDPHAAPYGDVTERPLADLALPPSLAVTPNIPFERQSLAELRLERAYWQARIEAATGWGASLKAADDCRRACDAWISRREKETAHG
jgi:hypothetical protein